MCVHVCQRAHIRVKVLLVHRLLWEEKEQPPRRDKRQTVSGGGEKERILLFFFKVSSGNFGRQKERKEGKKGSHQQRKILFFNIASDVFTSACGTTQLQHMQKPGGGWSADGQMDVHVQQMETKKKQDAKKNNAEMKGDTIGNQE